MSHWRKGKDDRCRIGRLSAAVLSIMFVLFSALLMLGTLRLSVLGGPVNGCDCPNIDCTEKATPAVWLSM